MMFQLDQPEPVQLLAADPDRRSVVIRVIGGDVRVAASPAVDRDNGLRVREADGSCFDPYSPQAALWGFARNFAVVVLDLD